ncbi:hypothetical protein AMTR_s00089p00095300 [Amborella trichopoda]|uniref:Uncharacterized protein n=1 Tax=Amborella trichopoda TaxID=13333 RepID=W1NW40_AMBTC|nr:hypothetical protein AMTR_s00089p00095300 [Amborella trichopoda]
MPTAKELWAALKTKYREEDAANELASNDIKLDEAFYVEAIIDKWPPSWKDYRNTLMHKLEDFSLEYLMTYLRIEETRL